MVKDVKYIYWVKKDLFGCFRIEEIRDKDNEIGLKERGGIEMSTTVLSIYAMPLLYLPVKYGKIGITHTVFNCHGLHIGNVADHTSKTK